MLRKLPRKRSFSLRVSAECSCPSDGARYLIAVHAAALVRRAAELKGRVGWRATAMHALPSLRPRGATRAERFPQRSRVLLRRKSFRVRCRHRRLNGHGARGRENQRWKGRPDGRCSPTRPGPRRDLVKMVGRDRTERPGNGRRQMLLARFWIKPSCSTSLSLVANLRRKGGLWVDVHLRRRRQACDLCKCSPLVRVVPVDDRTEHDGALCVFDFNRISSLGVDSGHVQINQLLCGPATSFRRREHKSQFPRKQRAVTAWSQPLPCALNNCVRTDADAEG